MSEQQSGSSSDQSARDDAPAPRKPRRSLALRRMTLWNQIEAARYYGVFPLGKVIYFGSNHNDVDGNESGVAASEAGAFIMNMEIIEAYLKDERKEERNIRIILNTPGGDEYHGYAIYDKIVAARERFTITVEGMGYVMSAGSFIMQAATRRLMYPNATMLLHYGTWGYDGNSKDFDKWSQENQRVRKIYKDVYLTRIREKHPDYIADDLEKMLVTDTFLSAKETIELGLADEIVASPRT